MIYSEELGVSFLKLKSILWDTGGGTTSVTTIEFPPISASARYFISWLHKQTHWDTEAIEMTNDRSLQLLQVTKVKDVHEPIIIQQGGQLVYGDDCIQIECLICYKIIPVSMWKCRIEIQNLLAETLWYAEQLRLNIYTTFIPDDTLSQMPRKPEPGEGIDGWFAFKTSMDAAGYKYTFEQMANDSCWSVGNLKKKHAIWKAEFGLENER